jgi:hypothetical protein
MLIVVGTPERELQLTLFDLYPFLNRHNYGQTPPPSNDCQNLMMWFLWRYLAGHVGPGVTWALTKVVDPVLYMILRD